MLCDNHNYLTKKELGAVCHLLDTLDKFDEADGALTLEARLFDSNGECVGRVTKKADGYVALRHES